MRELKVLGISGSLRAGSMNSALLRAAQKHAPSGVSIDIYTGLGDVPPYDGDLDTEAPPVAVSDLRAAIAAADALLIATPEYNYSIPGVLKNALDWASRPAQTSVLLGKHIAMMGAAPGNFGTVRAQLALRQVFVWTRSRVLPHPEVMVFRAGERFDDAGTLTDESTIEHVVSLLDALERQVGGR